MAKERPILFSAPMVRALLGGTKTQTRRIIHPPPPAWVVSAGVSRSNPGAHSFFSSPGYNEGRASVALLCPYGQPGDRLWVRESVFIAPPDFGDTNAVDDEGRPRLVGYAATMFGDGMEAARAYGVKKTPSIYMPRWASRLLLEVAEVRVQRLHEISEADAEAEGLSLSDAIKTKVPSVRDTYALLWDDINGKRAPWASNPWVWAISFKAVPRG